MMGDNILTLPDGWKSERLGDINTAVSKSVVPTAFSDETFEYYSIPAFQEFGAPILTRGSEILSNKNLVKNGTVMFGKLNPRVLKVWLVNSTSPYRKIASTEFLPILPNEEAVAEFIYFFCQSSILVAQANQLVNGSTPSRERVDKKSFYDIWIPLPPLPEQHAIARTLRAVQQAKDVRQHELTLERERKAALMEHLFTHGTHGESRKQTKIGAIPESWDVAQLGKLAKIGNGSTPKRTNNAYWDSGNIPWLTSGKIHEGVIRSADEFVTEVAIRECHLPKVKAGSLLVAITGEGKTLGNTALVTFDTCINQHLASVQFNNSRVLPQFALWFLQSRYQHLRSMSQMGGSTKGALTCGYLKTYPIPLPDEGEQKIISEIFDNLTNKIAALEREAQVLDELFRAMLDELMTGRLTAVPLIGVISE